METKTALKKLQHTESIYWLLRVLYKLLQLVGKQGMQEHESLRPSNLIQPLPYYPLEPVFIQL